MCYNILCPDSPQLFHSLHHNNPGALWIPPGHQKQHNNPCPNKHIADHVVTSSLSLLSIAAL